jgi:hypothetical protein
MVGLQTLDLAIGVRVPASQPIRFNKNTPDIEQLLVLLSGLRQRRQLGCIFPGDFAIALAPIPLHLTPTDTSVKEHLPD